MDELNVVDMQTEGRPGFWPKMETYEPPELTLSHGYTESTATHEVILSEGNPETS